jgi:hypothetical protein
MTDRIRVGRCAALVGAPGTQKEREKLEREKQRDGITNAATKEDAAKSVKPQHVETVKKKTGSKPKIAPLSTQAAQQVFALPPPRTLPASTNLATPTLLPPPWRSAKFGRVVWLKYGVARRTMMSGPLLSKAMLAMMEERSPLLHLCRKRIARTSQSLRRMQRARTRTGW